MSQLPGNLTNEFTPWRVANGSGYVRDWWVGRVVGGKVEAAEGRRRRVRTFMTREAARELAERLNRLSGKPNSILKETNNDNS